MSSLFSVALPVFNGENYLSAALSSLTAQSGELSEIVVCDNASTDKTKEIVEEFSRLDGRIRYIRNAVHVGQSENVNRAISECSNEWVHIFCHDDVLLIGASKAISGLIERAKTEGARLICHQSRHLFRNGQTLHFIGQSPVMEPFDPAVPVESDVMNLKVLVHSPESMLQASLLRGKIPYLPSLTTATVQKEAFHKLGGFSNKWVHFDTFFWLDFIQVFRMLESDLRLTLTRVHSQQVAVNARRSLRSFNDYRQFFPHFATSLDERQNLGPVAKLRYVLIPISSAGTDLAICLLKRDYKQLLEAYNRLDCIYWGPVFVLALRHYLVLKSRFGNVWGKIPIGDIFE